MKVIENNDTDKLNSESTAIFIVNDIIDRVFNKIMTQDSKINLEPKSDVPSSSDDVTERDVRLKSSTRSQRSATISGRNLTDDAVLDTSDTESVRCSLPLEKIDDHILQELSSSASSSDEVQSVETSMIVSSTSTTPLKSSSSITTPSPTTSSSTTTSTCKKRLFCLYCDRIFVSSNLRQKHVERCHSANQLRRSSSRTPGHSKLSPSCMFCGQVENVGNDLKKLLEHLIIEHSMKYHACLDCEERFGSKESLKIHNSSVHGVENDTSTTTRTLEDDEKIELPQEISPNTSTEILPSYSTPLITNNITTDNTTEKNKKKRVRKSDVDTVVIDTLPPPPQNPMIEDFEDTIIANVISATELLKQKELMEKENALKLAELEKQKTTNRNTKKGGRTNSTGARSNNNETSTSSPRTTRRSTKSSASSTPVKTKSKTNKINNSISNHVSDEVNHLDQTKSENSISKTETISIKVTSTLCETSSPPNYEFDENFFTCVSFNIQENLLNHLDGKLHTNNELSPMSSLHLYHQTKGSKTSETNSAYTNANGDDDVNNLALTALTPVTTLLTSQIGIDAYRQIEYGSKAPKHHVTRKHYVKYNFRSRKQKPSDMDQQKDISKLDMWTQVAMKMRQQKIKTNLLDDEMNRRTEQQVEELNRILDTRGPFQDLHEEALNSQQNDEQNNSSTDEVKTVLEDILINVFDKLPSSSDTSSSTYENNSIVNLDKFISDRLKNASNQKALKLEDTKSRHITRRSRLRNESTNEKLIENETLSYFNLTRTPAASSSSSTLASSISVTRRTSIDMKTTTESLYKLGLDVKQMDQFLSEFDHEIIVSSSVELSGEWARPRIYICGACGVKITNLKLLEDHKQFIHPHVWCAHYEFVGNQSEFYPHLNIPGLGRILENEKKETIRNWEKSSARQCSKCQKECNTLGDLHRHMLECGGDWSWMLAKKKCKYRPFGARTRRRRVMELKRKLRVRLEGGSSSTGENTTRGVVERRRNRSKLEGPRPPRPSDADTIQRMLANLPPKRATRKIMSLKEQGLRKPNRLNPNKTNVVNSNRTKQLLKSPKTNNKNETIKAANQKMKQALQRNLRSRNQLNNVKNDTTTTERKVSPRTTRRSASNSPKNEKQLNNTDNSNTIVNNRKTKVQKVLASKIIDSNTALGPKSKIFSRKKTRFGETVVTRLRNKILLAQKYINSDNTVRLTRSRGLHVSKQQIDNEEIIKDNNEINQKKKPITTKNDNKPVEDEEEIPKTKRRLRSLKFLTKTLRSHKKINEVTENIQNTPSTSPARRSNRMRILSRIQRKLPSFSRRSKDKNEPKTNENDNTITEIVKETEKIVTPSSDENIKKPSEDKINENLANNIPEIVEKTNKNNEIFDQPPVLEKIAPAKLKTNIDYCIDSVVANITGQVTYKEYPRSTVSTTEESKKSSFSLKTFTQNMRNITKKITNHSKNNSEPLNLSTDRSDIAESDAVLGEKIQLGKRKRVISTQTDINPSILDEEQPPLLFPQITIPPPLPLGAPVSMAPVVPSTPPIIPPVSTATIHDTISDTIEDVIAKYTVESSDGEDDFLTKSNKKLKVNTNGIGAEKCDTIPKNLSNQNFPMPILEAVGPPNDLKRGDSIVTIPILLPVVSHVIISTGTQINSNLLEKIMDTSINNFQLNNIVPNDKTNALLNHTLSPGAGKNYNNSEKILDTDINGKSPGGNKEYHNYVIETPMQKLIQNGLYPVLPPNSMSNVAFDNIQITETSGENSTQNLLKPEDPTKKDSKNKSKVLKKPIKKLNDCINMLKQKLMSSSSTTTENSDTNPRGDILKIPTPKFNKPPIFSDPIIKKITDAPFQTTPVKKSVDLSQGLDFSLPKNITEVDNDQTSPIDLSCSTTSKLFVDPPIANEVEHIVETKSIQKPPTKPKGSINFSDLPRQMELLANQAERREAERNQQQKQQESEKLNNVILTDKLITHHHPIILNVPEVVESASTLNSISNIELKKNQNEIVDEENRTKDGGEQNVVNITPLPLLIPPSNDLITKPLLSQNNSTIDKSITEFDSNDNISKIPIDLSSHTIQETSTSHVLDVQNLVSNPSVEKENDHRTLRGSRKRGTSRRIGSVRTRPIRKCNTNEEESPVSNEIHRDDVGSDTSFEDVPLIKLVQSKDDEKSLENIPQNLVKTTPPVVDNLSDIINQVAKNTINKPKDNLTDIINQVAENTINKEDNSKQTIEIILPAVVTNEIKKSIEVIESDLLKKLPEINQSKEQISNLMKVRKKPGRKPKSVFEPLDKPLIDISKSDISEQSVITNVVYHSTPEIKSTDQSGGYQNLSCTTDNTDDFDLENALPLFTVGKISPLPKVSVQDPKMLMVGPLKSKLEVPTPSAVDAVENTSNETTKRPRLKPGRKPKKLLEQIENKTEHVSNIVVVGNELQKELPVENKAESTNISSGLIPPEAIEANKFESSDISPNLTETNTPITENKIENSSTLSQMKKPGRRSKKQLEQIEIPISISENNQRNQIDLQDKEVQIESVPEASITLQENATNDSPVGDIETEKVESIENLISNNSSQSKKPGRKSKKILDENKSDSPNNRLENISESSSTLQDSTTNDSVVENTEIEKLSIETITQSKKPGRKPKKILDENHSESANVSSEILREPESILSRKDQNATQNNSSETTKSEISKELTDENSISKNSSQSKKPGRKPNKVTEENKSEFISNTLNDISKEPENVLNKEDHNSFQNESSQIIESDITKEMINETSNGKDSLQVQKSGRKSKKTLDENKEETSNISCDILKEPENVLSMEESNSIQNNFSQITTSDIAKELTTEISIDKNSSQSKKTGRKSKKVSEENQSEVSNTSNDKDLENVLNIEDENLIQDNSSKIIASDNSKELAIKNSIAKNSSQSKKPGRKSKKVSEEKQSEASNTPSGIMKEPENLSNIDDQNSIQNESDITEEIIIETSITKNSLQSRKSGRKSKKILDETIPEPSNISSEILKEPENVLSMEDQNSIQNDSSQIMESDITKELTIEKSIANNSSQSKKFGRKSKKILDENISENSNVFSDIVKESENVLNIEDLNSTPNDSSQMLQSDISIDLTVENTISKNSSQSKKPGRKPKKVSEESKSESSHIANDILKEPENPLKIDQNSRQNDSSEIIESDIVTIENSVAKNSLQSRKPGRKPKKALEENKSESSISSSDILKQTEYISGDQSINSTQNDSQIIESDISKELTNDITSNVLDKSEDLSENKNLLTKNDSSNNENLLETSAIFQENISNPIVENSSQFKRPGRKPRKSLKQPEKDDTSNETRSDTLNEKVNETIPADVEMEQISIDIKSLPIRKSGRRSKNSSLERPQNNVDNSDIEHQKDDNVPTIETPHLRKPGRKSKKSLDQLESSFETSNENSKKNIEIVKPNLDHHEDRENLIENNTSCDYQSNIMENKLESSNTLEDNSKVITIEGTPGKERENQESFESNLVTLNPPHQKGNNSTINDELNQNSNELGDASIKKPGRKPKKIIMEQTKNENIPAMDNEITENSNELDENSSQVKKSDRKSRKIIVEQLENKEENKNIAIIDNEISEDSNTSKSSSHSRKSGRKSKRIFENVENIAESTFENIPLTEDYELCQNSRRKSGRKSKSSVEQSQISDLSQSIEKDSNSELNESLLHQIHNEQQKSIKINKLPENKFENSDLLSEPIEIIDISNDEEILNEPTATRSKSKRTPKKLLEQTNDSEKLNTLDNVGLGQKSIKTKEQPQNKLENSDLEYDTSEMDIHNDEDLIEPTATRSKTKRTSKKLLEQPNILSLSEKSDDLDIVLLLNESLPEPKMTRSKLEQKSKDLENTYENNTVFENVSCDNITQETKNTNSRIKLRRKSTRISEPVINNSEINDPVNSNTIENNPTVKSGRKSKKLLEEFENKSLLESTNDLPKNDSDISKPLTSDSEDELPLAVLSKQTERVNHIENIEKSLPVIEKEKIETDLILKSSIEKINEIEVVPEKTNKQSAKIEKVSEIENVLEKTKKHDIKQIEFQFKEPEIRLSPIKTTKIFRSTPGDETTDDEGDIPLAQRFGISKIGNVNSKIIETKVNEDENNELKKPIEETIDEDSDKTDISSTVEENLSDKDGKLDLENKKRRGRPKKKEVISDEDYQFPRRITRRSNSSIVSSTMYGSFEDTDEIIQDQSAAITSENHVESTTDSNVVLSNILVENNQNIENLEQIDTKKPDKKIEKSNKIGEKFKTQENEFSPVDEVDSPVVTIHNEENALKSEVDKGGIIIHKLKKPRKISMPPPPPPPAPKKCEENLEKIRITFKKVSKLNSTIGLQLTDFENVQIITTPKTETVVQSAHKSTVTTASPSKAASRNPAEETDEESNIPLAERTFLQKPQLLAKTDDKNVFQFKQPGLPFSRAKRRNTLPAIFSAIDETTDEEADVPLAQRFGINKTSMINSNAAEETEDEDRIIPLAERLEKLRKKDDIPSYKNLTAAEETEDEDRIIPLAERLAKLKQLQVAKALHMKLPDPAEETEDEDRILPLAERIARENKKQLEAKSLNSILSLKTLPVVDPAEETEDEERILPLAERIAKSNKMWEAQLPQPPKPNTISAIPNPADETEDEERLIPLAQRIVKNKEVVVDAFQFKAPEIPELSSYQKKRKTAVPSAIFTPADETTDEEGDVPLARRFGLPKPLGDENVKKRKNSLDESSSTKYETNELHSRKRRKSTSSTLDINELSIESTKLPILENIEKPMSIDVFDFNEPDGPVTNLAFDDIRHKSKLQNVEEEPYDKINNFSKLPTEIIIENIPKKIATKIQAEKQKKSPVKKIFKIRKKRRKGKLKFTNRRYKKVLSKIIIEEPEIIEPALTSIEEPIHIDEGVKNIPDFELIDTIRSITPPVVEKNDIIEKSTENIIDEDDEVSRNSSLAGGDDGFDNRTDVSSLSDTTVPEPSEAIILERHSPLLLRIKTNFKAKGKRGRPPVKKISIAVDNTENYCEICNKHFCRADNLIKHKMTFTHIAKLSELEAKESEKRRLEQQQESEEVIPTTSSGDKDNNTTQLNDNISDEDDDDDVFEESSNFGNDVASRDLDELAMKFIVRKNRLMDDDSIGNSDEASSSTDAFNLGNGVNYPDLVTSHQPKRYRSLGERKSFDSNQSILSPDHQLLEEQNSPQIPDSIIQEDDEDDDNDSSHEIEPSTFETLPPQDQQRPKSQNNVVFDYLKKSSLDSTKDNHPTSSSTFEFISQTNQFEENFTRKKLNRDEELFLECCSLLKNNSKSRKIFDERNNDLQQSSSHHVIANSVEESTAARIDDWSNSNSVASDWLSQKGGSTTSNNNTSFNKRGQSNVSSFKFNTISSTTVDDVDGGIKNKLQNFEEIPFKSIAVNEYMDFSNINVNQDSENQKDTIKEKDDFSEIHSLLSTSSDTSVGRSSIHDEQSLSNSTSSNDEDRLNNSDDLSDFCESKQDDSTVDSKKIPTKGALKIFEGIKVSIPTQEINLAEVLSSTQNKILQNDNLQQNVDDYDDVNSKKCHNTNSNSNSVDSHSLKLYKNGVEVSQSILKSSKKSSSYVEKKSDSEKDDDDDEESTTVLSTTSTKKRLANKFNTKKKITKKSPASSTKTKSTPKAKDIYDFEDSQDEFDGDQQLNFKTYRDQKLFSPNDTKDIEATTVSIEKNVIENNSDSDDDNHDYIDSFSVDESSHSSDEDNTETTKIESSPQQIPLKKPQSSMKGVKNENKKGMIMGRIFKHVVKSKTPDVGSSPNTKDANTLFDSLIGEKSNQETIPEAVVEQQSPAPAVKKAPGTNKAGKKPGKRTKPADSSSDDDFCLTRKPQKKINRRKKGNTSSKDENESGSGINLEQEIRECIGVAGRKSQRKCTSGKQNILVEFWSSDELSDGEKRIMRDNTENNIVDENNVNKENENTEENLKLTKPSLESPIIENNPLNETVVNINEKIPKSNNVKRKVVMRNTKPGGQVGVTTVAAAKRKPSRVQMNKVSRKCSKIRNKTKARGRRKKLLPNNNNLDTQKNNHHQMTTTTNSLAVTRRKRSASEKLYYWSSSSDDEFEDFIEVKPIRDDPPDDEDRPMHHGWIVGDSPKKLVTMLAQAKGNKKVDAVYVKEQGKRNRVTL